MTEVSTDEAQSLDLLAVFEGERGKTPLALMMPPACEGCGKGTKIWAFSQPARIDPTVYGFP
jgi:hypothetical protein